MKKRRSLFVSTVIILFIIICITIITAKMQKESTPIIADTSYTDSAHYVEMIDVGQGDCCLIASDSSYMLIDCGETNHADNVIQTLKAKDIHFLDLVIISHPHSDHMGGLSQIMDSIGVKTILIDTDSPEEDADLDAYNRLIDQCEETDTQLLSRDQYESIEFGEFHLELLPQCPGPDDENDRSIIIRASCMGSVFLFTGDMSEKYEKYLVNSGISLSCDVLKASHHGSAFSNCDRFLDAADPSVCMIGVGADNRYGHPHEQTLNRLKSRNIKVYRTDINGNITINAETLTVKTKA